MRLSGLGVSFVWMNMLRCVTTRAAVAAGRRTALCTKADGRSEHSKGQTSGAAVQTHSDGEREKAKEGEGKSRKKERPRNYTLSLSPSFAALVLTGVGDGRSGEACATHGNARSAQRRAEHSRCVQKEG